MSNAGSQDAFDTQTLDVKPGPRDRTVRLKSGRVLEVPEAWALLPPGDGTLTRRVKKAGPSWTVKEKKGRRTFSKGVWALAETIEAEREKLEAERATPAYKKKLAASRKRRAKKQAEYVEDFHAEVLDFLGFPTQYADLAAQMAEAITAHATPVGSGTVARTKRIPLEERVEAAVIAWMRHQTTAYDQMSIPRVKGKRREVRRMLAQRSRELLDTYRRGDDIDLATCPLARALQR